MQPSAQVEISVDTSRGCESRVVHDDEENEVGEDFISQEPTTPDEQGEDFAMMWSALFEAENALSGMVYLRGLQSDKINWLD